MAKNAQRFCLKFSENKDKCAMPTELKLIALQQADEEFGLLMVSSPARLAKPVEEGDPDDLAANLGFLDSLPLRAFGSTAGNDTDAFLVGICISLKNHIWQPHRR